MVCCLKAKYFSYSPPEFLCFPVNRGVTGMPRIPVFAGARVSIKVKQAIKGMSRWQLLAQ